MGSTRSLERGALFVGHSFTAQGAERAEHYVRLFGPNDYPAADLSS